MAEAWTESLVMEGGGQATMAVLVGGEYRI